MDIIEGILKLGSVVVDAMIFASESYSKNERISSSEKEYFKEIHDGLVLAKKDLRDYINQRGSSKFELIRNNEVNIDKLFTKSKDPEIQKIYVLIAAYFGLYRNNDHFYFFDIDSDRNPKFKESVIHFIKKGFAKNAEMTQVTPIMAVYFNSIKYCNRTDACTYLDTLLFCEEGVAYEFKDEFKVIPYKEVGKIFVSTKRKTFRSYQIYFLRKNKQPCDSFVMERHYSARIDLKALDYPNIAAQAFYDYIKCFNPECEFDRDFKVKK